MDKVKSQITHMANKADSGLCRFLILFFKICKLTKFAKAKAFLFRISLNLEGGVMWSMNYRNLLAEFKEISLGKYSYADALFLQSGVIPRGTKVGNYCSLAPGLEIKRRNHPVEKISQHPFFYNAHCGFLEKDLIPADQDNVLTIGHDVWIGQNVIITPACKSIGNGAIIAAGSVVTKDVAPFVIIDGVPAKFLKWRFSLEVQEAWAQSEWWTKSMSELTDVFELFLAKATPEIVMKLCTHSDSK